MPRPAPKDSWFVHSAIIPSHSPNQQPSLTCRQRKIRCDRNVPECRNCTKSKRTCVQSEGPPTRYIIHTTDTEDQDTMFEPRKQHTSNPIHDQQSNLDLDPPLTSRTLPSDLLKHMIITRIFQHYIDVLAPWYDLNDAHSLFGTAVPLRGLNNPVLLQAIIAFSACHLKKIIPHCPGIDTLFHTSCVEGMLVALKEPRLENQEDYLAATCLLRSYEILNGDMESHQHHLLGAYSFAANNPIDLTSHGLAQAGTWNYLREEITVALSSHRPVRLSTGFHFVLSSNMADDMLANAITLILAKIINLRFCDETSEASTSREERWHELVAEVSSWREHLPPSFRPFSTAPKAGNAFPSIWHLRPWHVAAEMYYSLAEILLELSRPSSITASHTAPLKRDEQKAVGYVLNICGLAYTNEDVSARVNAFGPLSFCGRYLRDVKHRTALLLMFNDFAKLTGWPAIPIIEDLQQHWTESDNEMS